MLKITIIDGPTEQRLVLEGRLAEPNLPILKSAWEGARTARGTRQCLVDLRSTTFIDRSAEQVLLELKREGAQFIACGVSTTHQLEQFGIKCKGSTPKVRQ